MSQPSAPALQPYKASRAVQRIAKLALALALIGGGAALHAAAGQLPGLVLDHAWRAAATRVHAPAAFGAGQAAETSRLTTAVLRNIGGEVFPAAAMQAAAGRTITDGGAVEPLPNVSPAALDRLSAGDCITVTTKAGQSLSFRITGARPAAGAKAGALPNIDLAVTACTDAGEPVAKAVIEPQRKPEPQRSL